jgi:hypothetical protein
MMSAAMLPMSHPVGVYADTGVASHDRFPGPNAPAGGCSPLKHPRLFGFNGTAWKDTAQKKPPFGRFSWFHDTSLDGMKQASGAEIGFISWIYLIDLYALAEAMPLFIPPKIPP